MKTTLFVIICCFTLGAAAQNVGVGTTTPHSSAMLDVTSNNKGLLIPRMTEAQKTQVATPATGLLIWQTDGTPGFYYNGGTPEGPKWYMLSTEAENFWRLSGNLGTDMANHFIGTTDAQGLRFRVRNVFSGQLDSAKATLFGYKAGWQSTEISTTAFGTEALAAPSAELANAAFGYQAATKTRSGGFNTALGTQALYENISGTSNTAAGAVAMFKNVSGSRNTVVGAGAMAESDTADDNTAFGYSALGVNKADKNSAFGTGALAANTSGSSNTAMGTSSLRHNTTGSENTAVGTALVRNTIGNDNTAVGNAALYFNTEGYNNTAMGAAALLNNSVGVENTAIGRWALNSNNTSSENVAVGSYALMMVKSQGQNTAVGFRALQLNEAQGNTAIGSYAGNKTTTGMAITAVGERALESNTVGSFNTAVGTFSLRLNTNGVNNVAVGNQALEKNGSGSTNVGLGNNALGANTIGNSNTAVGFNTLPANTTGESNVAVGYAAGFVNVQGSGNTFIGQQANPAQTNYNNATAIGNRSLVNCSNCLVLGSVAGQNNAASSVNVGIGTVAPTEVLTINGTNPIVQLQHAGANKGFLQITGGQDVKIGTNIDNDLGSFFIRTNGADRVKVDPNGNVGVGTSSPAVRFQVGVNGDGSVARANAWQTFSDERFKKEVQPIDNALQKIKDLQGYYYQWINGSDNTRQAGFLAQEVEKVLPEIVSTDGEGYKSVDYGKMNALLLQAIKEQQVLIERLLLQVTSNK